MCELMSDVCSFCHAQESTSAGKRVVRSDCAGRRTRPSSVCDSYVGTGCPSSLGLRAIRSPAPFLRNVCCVLEAAKRR